VKKISRPYLEMKVVKVKKEKKYSDKIIIDGKKYTLCEEEYLHKEKDHWVNGENLDRIKFPVLCSYIDPEDIKKHIGMLNKYVKWYRLYNIEKQTNDNFVDDCTSLKNLIRDYNIHILKGKIILFEEE